MQEPTISITCKAESGDIQKYTFKIKRIDKTVSEIEEEIGKKKAMLFILTNQSFISKQIFSSALAQF